MEKTFAALILAVWVGLVAVNIVVPNQDFSVLENRFLSKLPTFSLETLVSGEYMQKMDEYINDHFIARDVWVSVKTTSEYLIGKRESNGVFIGKGALQPSLTDPDEKAVNRNIEGIQSFVKQYGLPSSLMIIPSSSEIQKDKHPPYAQVFDQKAFINEVYARLSGVVSPIDAYGALAREAGEYIYYKTDHHWTTDGAYAAYASACEALGIPVRPYEEFAVQQVSDSFYGTLYSKSGFRFVSPDTIKAVSLNQTKKYSVTTATAPKEYDSIYFKEFLDKKDKYSYFLGTNEALVTIETNAGTGKSLLVFKDSYAHSFVPFLMGDYDRITLVDMRYLNAGLGIVKVEDYDQALFLYSVDVFSHQSDIGKLRTNSK